MSHLNRPIKAYKQYTGVFSLDFTSSNGNALENIAHADLNFADEYSVMAWIKPGNTFETGVIWRTTDILSAEFQRLSQTSFGNSFEMLMRDTSGSSRRCFTWDANGKNVWTQAVAVNNSTGNTIDVYTDGVLGSNKVELQNNQNTLTNPPRTCIIGNQAPSHVKSYAGRIYQVAVWNSKLTASEVFAIWNGGNGRAFDLTVDSGDYVSSANLQHLWSPGKATVPNLGKDYGNGTAVDLTDVNDLDDTDRVEDAPT